MVDFNKVLGDLDLSAVVLLNDKLNECNFFYELLQQEPDRNRFRWLFGAFLNSCYGYLEDKASYFYYAHCNPESGEPIADQKSLEILNKDVGSKKVLNKKKNTEHIKTFANSELMKKLYKYRNVSTHDGGIGIMIVGDNLPCDFYIGHKKSEGISALKFCNDVLSCFTKIEQELNT
ncbi:hypothetical protein [Rheinheimera sp.]|uniref:hypothetical protein n=1 Tax=Rheinheimera sp. TaxID=1869214 RepID=UPI0023575CC5|nr:hypothetical protein [Rheinheimera sp.]